LRDADFSIVGVLAQTTDRARTVYLAASRGSFVATMMLFATAPSRLSGKTYAIDQRPESSPDAPNSRDPNSMVDHCFRGTVNLAVRDGHFMPTMLIPVHGISNRQGR